MIRKQPDQVAVFDLRRCQNIALIQLRDGFVSERVREDSKSHLSVSLHTTVSGLELASCVMVEVMVALKRRV